MIRTQIDSVGDDQPTVEKIGEVVFVQIGLCNFEMDAKSAQHLRDQLTAALDAHDHTHT